MSQKNAREISLDMITDIMENDKFSHIILRERLKDIEEKQDRSFITRLVMGTIERAITLDYIIDSFSKTKVKKMKPFIRNLLRMSVYQIVYMNQVPDSAVCNEAVKLAKKRKFVNLSGFVNGILRNISRNKENISFPKLDCAYGISINYSTPLWIVEKIIEDYGINKCKKILSDIADKSGVMVRVNTSLKTVKEAIDSVEAQGAVAEAGKYYKNAILIKEIDNIETLEAFKNGYIQPQDESSMLVGMVASPKKDDFVVDVCSAPGGKSIHIADLLCGTGKVSSRDLTEYKVNLINENITRTGFQNIEAKVYDALISDKDIMGKADIVIADVPCSGLGVLNKKADIKYKLKKESINELEELQKKIIDVVSKYVKPGGILVYSTCTINPGENMKNVEWIINNYDFSLENIDEYIPEELRNNDTRNGYLQLLQGVNECDGFFIARLRRGKG